MKKISQHDEREIKSYVKSNPQSFKYGKARNKALEGMKGDTNKIKGGKVHSKMSHLFGLDK